MNEREFCYWLQGLFEVGGVKSLDENQVQIIKDHLALVFKKVTPARPITPIIDEGTRTIPPIFRDPPPNTGMPPWVPYLGATCKMPEGNKVHVTC